MRGGARAQHAGCFGPGFWGVFWKGAFFDFDGIANYANFTNPLFELANGSRPFRKIGENDNTGIFGLAN